MTENITITITPEQLASIQHDINRLQKEARREQGNTRAYACFMAELEGMESVLRTLGIKLTY